MLLISRQKRKSTFGLITWNNRYLEYEWEGKNKQITTYKKMKISEYKGIIRTKHDCQK